MNISPHTSARYGMHEEGMNLAVSGIYALQVGRPMYDKLEKILCRGSERLDEHLRKFRFTWEVKSKHADRPTRILKAPLLLQSRKRSCRLRTGPYKTKPYVLSPRYTVSNRE